MVDTEAVRQLDICNACRYCEGYCAVFPALERRRDLGPGDLLQLANLCHDCRACYDACMYAPPHEFAINIPALLSKTRLESLEELPTLGIPGASGGGRRGLGAAGIAVVAAVVVVVAGTTSGWRTLVHSDGGSPYAVVPYGALVTLAFVAAGVAVLVAGIAGHRYWHRVGGRTRDLFHPRALLGALADAASLRYQRGGGPGCTTEDGEPSAERRMAHQVTVAGFMLAFASTVTAAIAEHGFGDAPPFHLASVPVILGLAGGVLLVVGLGGLLAAKRRLAPAATYPAMTVRDEALLGALGLLGVSGLATLALRTTAAFPAVFVLHLTAVLACFVVAPFSKFAHGWYRLLALVKDRLEQRA